MMLPESCPLKENLVPSLDACSAQGQQLGSASVSRAGAGSLPCTRCPAASPRAAARRCRRDFGKAGNLSSVLISRQRSYFSPGSRRRDKSWQMALSVPGLCTPRCPAASAPALPKEKLSVPRAPRSRCRGRDGFTADFFSPSSSPTLPLPAASSGPVSCSSLCPRHGFAHQGGSSVFTF